MKIKYKSGSFDIDYDDDSNRDTVNSDAEANARCSHIMRLIDADIQSTLKHSELSRKIREMEIQSHPFMKKE